MGNATHFRRTVVGLSLVAWPLLGLVGALLQPQYTGSLEDEIVAIAQQPATWQFATMLALLAMFVAIPAVWGILHLLRNRSVVLGHIGGGLTLLGLFFHGAVIGFSLSEVPLALSSMDRGELVPMVEGIYEHSAFTMLLFPFLGFYLGWILLAVALWRARIVPLWVMVAIIVGLLSEFAGTDAYSPELLYTLHLVAGGWLGLKILRMSDPQWEHAGTEASTTGEIVGQPAPTS